MKFFCYLLVFVTVFIFSCKKKEFPPSNVETQSEFYFNGSIDGVPVSLKSGTNNYYMYSSYKQDSNNVYNFAADLKQNTCNNCPNSIGIKINDFRISAPNAPALIDSSLAIKSYPIMGVPLYAVQFQSLYSQTAASYLWDFGDNNTSTLANPTHTYNTLGNYGISLKITGTNSCQQYIKNVEKIRYPATNCNISLISTANTTIHCSGNAQGPGPYKWSWDFGDGFRDSISSPTHTYKIAGTYPVSLRVIDANKDTSYSKYNVATQTNPMPCLTNYLISSITPVNDIIAFSKVTITWTDAGGTVYSSNNLSQPVASYFKIISVENYDLNERHETTKKIKVQFKCNVYNGTAVKVLDNVEAVIAVSYK